MIDRYKDKAALTYQQMNVGGDTRSASEAGNSPGEQYQPLASNSSQHRLPHGVRPLRRER